MDKGVLSDGEHIFLELRFANQHGLVAGAGRKLFRCCPGSLKM
jgi:hypothetical protein